MCSVKDLQFCNIYYWLLISFQTDQGNQMKD